tara:strand:- start:28268 stop:29407 length:1140 start_codon:yes stop_codon:yes gene_type:complete
MFREIKYFKGLNSLRFFAAYLVVIHHAEQIRMKYGLFHLKEYSLFNNGGIAVTFFFVLSGFLISYLLLKERNTTNTIAVKNFYYRRILRIWPLYFFLIVIGTLLLPYILDLLDYSYIMPYAFNEVIYYYIFFAPFMVNIFYGHHLLEPLWSIGVEELFYILWAPFFKFFKKYILSIIIVIILFRIIIMCISYLGLFDPIIDRLVRMLRFEAMAIGGLAAYLVFNNKNLLSSFLFSRFIQSLLITFILLRLFAFQFLVDNNIIFNVLFNTPVLSNLLLTTVFGWLIINISINPKCIISLDAKLLNFLGSISYGIYMYHMLIIFGIIVLFKGYLSDLNHFYSTIFLYLALTIIVILVSFLSKKFFEDYFLRFKNRYRIINL